MTQIYTLRTCVELPLSHVSRPWAAASLTRPHLMHTAFAGVHLCFCLPSNASFIPRLIQHIFLTALMCHANSIFCFKSRPKGEGSRCSISASRPLALLAGSVGPFWGFVMAGVGFGVLGFRVQAFRVSRFRALGFGVVGAGVK